MTQICRKLDTQQAHIPFAYRKVVNPMVVFRHYLLSRWYSRKSYQKSRHLRNAETLD